MLRKITVAIAGTLLVSGLAMGASLEHDHMSADTGPVIGGGSPSQSVAAPRPVDGHTFDHMSADSGPRIGAADNAGARGATRGFAGVYGNSTPAVARGANDD